MNLTAPFMCFKLISGEEGVTSPQSLTRSKTMPLNKISGSESQERLKTARDAAEKAIKVYIP